MPVTNVFRLHDDRVLWPEHRPLESVLELKDTTPEAIFETTYQGNSAAPGGTVFKREWWNGKNRFKHGTTNPVARWISFDTAASEKENAAYTAWAVGDLLKDYRMAIVEIGRERLEFPQLISKIETVARTYYDNGLLRNVVIEDKSSGTGALQTLKQVSPDWLKPLLQGYNPRVDKYTRWSQAAMWCKLGCILLPWPDNAVPWLNSAEEEIFNVPNAAELDQADSLSQLVIFIENFLSLGYQARNRTQ